MPGHLDLRTEGEGPRRFLTGRSVQLEPAPDILGAELEQHAVQAERDMARVRKALRRVSSAVDGGVAATVAQQLARKAAFAAAAADSALERLSDAARSGLHPEEAVDLLLAARSTTDALRESADLTEMAANLVTPPPLGPEA